MDCCYCDCERGHGCPASALLFVLFLTFNIDYFQYTQYQNFIHASSNFPPAYISELSDVILGH